MNANPRISVTCDDKLYSSLSRISQIQNKSLSSVARELLDFAVEHAEDMYFSKLADKREEENTKLMSHEDVWK